MATVNGICRNATCPDAKSGVLFEWYEGPGEYCPQCGDRLEITSAAAPPTPVAAPPTSAPFGGLSASDALKQFEAQETPVASSAPRPAKPRIPRAVFAVGGIAIAAIIATIEVHPTAIGHPASDAIRVCRSSMTERFSDEVIRAYSAKSGAPTTGFVSSRSGPCNVRFAVSNQARIADAVGADAVVVVINPANAVTHISEENVRRIFAGEITDWSALGGKAAPIVALMPEDGSDEAVMLYSGLLHGVRIGSNVVRLPASTDVTRSVVRADKRGAIGLVAFGEAVPAKVLTLGVNLAPSPLSIAEHRYPHSLSVIVGVDGAPRDAATALVQYARSEEAQAIVSRSGLVSKKGI